MPDNALKNSELARAASTRRGAAHVQTTIEITKDYLHFSAAHFTVFSATDRENLHGHNFDVSCFVDTVIGDDGLAFDYNTIKGKLEALCNELDERTLLPAESPFLSFGREKLGSQTYLIAHFSEERIPFLERDALMLPIRNATVEEFSRWFIERLTADDIIMALPISALRIRISSGPGQWASCQWSRS